MRRWGLVITLFYAVILVVLLMPALTYLTMGIDSSGWHGFFEHVREGYTTWATWPILAIPVAAEALLLFLRVDTTQKRLKPRTRLTVSAGMAGLFLSILSVASLLCMWVIGKDDHAPAIFDDNPLTSILVVCVFFWLVWSVLFYLISRDSTDPVTRAVSWLIRGSVLELLIAVPAHVIVRRRNDCSAPIATGFGITSGIAIMLLAFGPSVFARGGLTFGTVNSTLLSGEFPYQIRVRNLHMKRRRAELLAWRRTSHTTIPRKSLAKFREAGESASYSLLG